MFFLQHLIEKQGTADLDSSSRIASHLNFHAYFTQTDSIVIVLMPPARKELPCTLDMLVVPLPIRVTDGIDLAFKFSNQFTQPGPDSLKF